MTPSYMLIAEDLWEQLQNSSFPILNAAKRLSLDFGVAYRTADVSFHTPPSTYPAKFEDFPESEKVMHAFARLLRAKYYKEARKEAEHRKYYETQSAAAYISALLLPTIADEVEKSFPHLDAAKLRNLEYDVLYGSFKAWLCMVIRTLPHKEEKTATHLKLVGE